MTHSIVATARYKRFGDGKSGCSELLRKAVMCSLADLARPDGGAISASVPTIARLAGCSDRKVQACLAEFVGEGLIAQTGEQRCRGGYTRIWRIDLDKLAALPDVKGAQPRRTSKARTGAVTAPVRVASIRVVEIR